MSIKASSSSSHSLKVSCTMKNEIIFTAVVLLCSELCQAQWTPDPFCPFPSDHVTRYPKYGNCSVYWECYEGTKYIMQCPEGSEFNAPLQQCDTPSIARCNPFAATTGNPNPPTYTPPSTVSHGPGPNCPPASDQLIYFPYDGDCTRYWECFEGDSYLYNCPDGLWWHEAISECDYPGDFCYQGQTSPPPPECENLSDVPTYTPVYGDCASYLQCMGGKIFPGHCADGLWWHQEISACDKPGEYCATSTTTQRPTPPIQPSCEGVGSEPVFYPVEDDCTRYYECVDGQFFEGNCSLGLWWHQSIKECDSPGEYCYSYSTPPNGDDVVCPEQNDQAVYFPYKGDCSKYWECFEGLKYLSSCPPNQWWHQTTARCEEPGSYCQN